MMEKVIRDGKVAVLYSPGYGAGWYTWNREHPECLFDPRVVAWVEGGKIGTPPLMEEVHEWEYFYDGGIRDLVVEWIPVGAKFRIEEYDGWESLVLEEEEDWLTA